MLFNVNVLAGLFAVFAAATGDVIQCFQCNSVTHPDCATLTTADTNSTHYRDCNETLIKSGKTPFCRKTSLRILDEVKTVRVLRECGYEVYKSNTTRCYEVDTDFKYEVNCQCFENGCNSAPRRLSRSYFLTFLAAVLGFVIRRGH